MSVNPLFFCLIFLDYNGTRKIRSSRHKLAQNYDTHFNSKKRKVGAKEMDPLKLFFLKNDDEFLQIFIVKRRLHVVT